MKKNDVHILVVDDDQSIRQVLSEAIKRSGFKVTALSNPAEAESLSKMKPVHLAIIDCMLPVMNGIDLTKTLLQTTMKNVPVILISGVFKDRQFELDALKKSGAVKFFTKPFELGEIIHEINILIKPFIDEQVGSLASLLTKVDVSKRESRKTLDFLEDISGYDLMLIFNVLLKSKATGYLNIVDSKQELYGFSLDKGKVVDLDTLKNKEILLPLLVEKNLLSEGETDLIADSIDKKDPLGYLKNECLISPHVAKVIKSEKIISDLSYLISQKNINVNFIESEVNNDSDIILANNEIDNLFFNIIFNDIPKEWFQNFYSEWMAKEIQLGESIDLKSIFNQVSAHSVSKDLLRKIEDGASIEELQEVFDEDTIYRLVHHMLVLRDLCFANERKVKSLDKHVKKLQDIFEKIDGKTVFEIFQFFGASEKPSEFEIGKIYKEVSRSYHPDKLPRNVDKSVVELNTKVFSAVSHAHNVLMDPEKRKAYINKIQESAAQKQFQAEELMSQGRTFLDLSRFKDALLLLQQARTLHESSQLNLLYLWARIKTEPEKVKSEHGKLTMELKNFETNDKRSALYYLVMGLLSGLVANFDEAEAHYSRALEFDKDFLAARREITVLKSQKGVIEKTRTGTTDLLTGDITAIIGNLFNKKKKSG